MLIRHFNQPFRLAFNSKTATCGAFFGLIVLAHTRARETPVAYYRRSVKAKATVSEHLETVLLNLYDSFVETADTNFNKIELLRIERFFMITNCISYGCFREHAQLNWIISKYTRQDSKTAFGNSMSTGVC